ncbi:16S rRNA (uracil(1498)-N(3))-methyltransferase [Arthrobacter halodurans]|uniref:Ribosomal RNA small subunit methyltransferase E n=1 Tax=Arthrobacter halodurans TaxID=516699 RepID=A0ABV4UL02_9MICC
MSNQAFLTPPETLAAAVPGDTVELDGPEGRHAVAVKRIRVGEAVDLLDGEGRRAVCVVTETGKASLRARIERIDVEAAPRVLTVLVQALAKGDRDLQAVESAVELGIDRVLPWQAERCVVRWAADKADKGRAKWEATVRAAVKQSRRARTPRVEPVAGTPQLAALARPAADDAGPAARRLVVVLHEEAASPLAEVVGDWLEASPADPGGPVGEVFLVVGPEGGIAPAEIESLRAAGAATASLGSNVLRASTAGPAALVLVRHLAGQLDPRRAPAAGEADR